jgi:hypothetical protein
MSIFLIQLQVLKTHYWGFILDFANAPNKLTINIDHTNDKQLYNNIIHIAGPIQVLTSISNITLQGLKSMTTKYPTISPFGIDGNTHSHAPLVIISPHQFFYLSPF